MEETVFKLQDFKSHFSYSSKYVIVALAFLFSENINNPKMKLSHLRMFPSRLSGLKPLVATYCVRRHVSRVSPLTSAFNSRRGKLFNFKLLESKSVVG